MSEDTKQCIIAILFICACYGSIYLFYYVSKYFNYI
jgi:hypothetical protein